MGNQKCCKKSISNFFKLNMLFRDVIMEDALLGVGITLAALMYDVMEEVRFFYRKTERIFSIVAMSGCGFEEHDASKEIFSALDYLRDNYGGIVSDWNVSDDEMKVTVRFPISTIDYQILMQLEMSDLPGRSVSATAYAQFDQAKVCIRRSTMYHSKLFEKMGGFRYILENRDNVVHNNIFEAIADFQKAFEMLYSTTAVYSTSFLAPFTEHLGKRRMQIATDSLAKRMQIGHAYPAIDVFCAVLRATHRKNLDSIRLSIVSALYAELFNSLVGENAITVAPKVDKTTRSTKGSTKVNRKQTRNG